MTLPEHAVEPPKKSESRKQLVITITFDNEKDLRNNVKYFVDNIENRVKYLTQNISVNNKLEGGATLDWNVSTDWTDRF